MKKLSVRDHFDTQRDGRWLRSYYITGEDNGSTQHHSLSGKRWSDMCERTRSDSHQQKWRPSYTGATNDFLGFQEFVEWSIGQVGYSERQVIGGKSWAWSLDKDFLGDGKSYSPDSCIFVPMQINNFLLGHNAARGKCPLGVVAHGNKYTSKVVHKGVKLYLGIYATQIEAHRAWQIKKSAIALEYAGEYADLHPRLTLGLRLFADRILDDHANFRITEYKKD